MNGIVCRVQIQEPSDVSEKCLLHSAHIQASILRLCYEILHAFLVQRIIIAERQGGEDDSLAVPHTCTPWSLNSITCGPMLVLALFPHGASCGDSWNKNGVSHLLVKACTGKTLPVIVICCVTDNKSKERILLTVSCGNVVQSNL
jgi:hypothetical protein